jgi:hypothetical protein
MHCVFVPISSGVASSQDSPPFDNPSAIQTGSTTRRCDADRKIGNEPLQ